MPATSILARGSGGFGVELGEFPLGGMGGSHPHAKGLGENG